MTEPLKPPREDLFRAVSASPVLERADGDEAGMPTMVVDFARFNEWTEIDSIFEGRFLERLAPTSMDKTIAESTDQMRVLFNHGKDPQIGDKVLGPIESITTSATGARGIVPLLDTSYNRDLIPALAAGLYGASFRFSVISEEFVNKPKRSATNPEGIPERTITETRVREWGPVTFPAYAGASAGLRSLTDEFLFGRLFDDPERLIELIEAFKERRDRSVVDPVEPEPPAATTRTEPEPPAATTPSKPAPARVRLTLGSQKEASPSWRL